MMMNQPMTMNNVMNQMIQNPELMQQWHDTMIQNQQQMQEIREQWIASIKENPQLMANMMGPITMDPELRQQMIDQMTQHHEMMQSMRTEDKWMGMMRGPMMGQGMMGQGMHGSGMGMQNCSWCPVMNGTNQQMTMIGWNMHNPQHMHNMMNQVWQDPQWRQQMHDMMIQNPGHMGPMMNQMMGPMTGPMMGPMMNDPQLRQQMLDMMAQNQDFMQNLRQNQQFLDEVEDDNDRNDDDKNYNDKDDEKYETRTSSQSTQVSIPIGTASPGCEQTNECYIPYSVSVKEHSSVTWTNDDTSVHTATSGTPANGPNGFFDSGLIAPGDSYTNQFNEEGTFDYYCIAHPWMTGKVIVVD